MFGKLLKHEIRHSARYNLLIYLAAAAITAIMGISLITDSTFIGMLSCFALYITGFATILVTFVSVIKNFYDTLFSRQGYLSLTLPVKGSSLLFSKLIISALWIIVSVIILVLTWGLIVFYTQSKNGYVFDMVKSVIESLNLSELLPSTGVIIQLLIMITLISVTSILTFVGYIFFTVALANTKPFQSHPKLFGGLIFFFLTLFTVRLGNTLTSLIPLTYNVTNEKTFFAFKAMGELEGVMLSYGIGGTIFHAIVAAILLAATGYIIENKVNLK